MKYGLSEQECFDVSNIMELMAERDDMPAEYGAMMKRGASLLKRAICLCTIFCQSYNNLENQCKKEEKFNDPNHEAD